MQLHKRKWIWVVSALLGVTFTACAGGSGSSGFDISASAENRVIVRALEERQCLEAEGVTICPADEHALVPPANVGPLFDGVEITTGLIDSEALRCVPPATQGTCTVDVFFASAGFPPTAAYAAAVRTVNPAGPWTIDAELTPVGVPEAPAFDAVMEVPADGVAVQVAFLVFLAPDSVPPRTVETLARSGADFAFVTTELTLRAE